MAARRPLTRARILRAALRLVDADGLDALTMRALAASLGVEAMSLYHHVPNKDAILQGLIDLVLSEADLPSTDTGMEEWVRGTTGALRRLAQQHPHVLPLLASRPVPMHDPQAAVPFEAGLAAFAAAGFTPGDAYAAVQMVLVTSLAMCILEQGLIEAGGDAAESRVADLPGATFPLLHALAESEPDPEALWAILVGTLIRGLTG